MGGKDGSSGSDLSKGNPEMKTDLRNRYHFLSAFCCIKDGFLKNNQRKEIGKEAELIFSAKNALYPLYSQIPAGIPDQPAVRQNRPGRHGNRVIGMNFKQRHEAEGNFGGGMKRPAVNNGIQRMNEKGILQTRGYCNSFFNNKWFTSWISKKNAGNRIDRKGYGSFFSLLMGTINFTGMGSNAYPCFCESSTLISMHEDPL